MPTRRKTVALASAVTVLFCAVVSVQFISLAKANPWFIFKATDPIPGTTPPVITWDNPVNGTVYGSNNITVSFKITKPQTPTPAETGLSQVDYTMDGQRTLLYYCTQVSSGSPPGLQGATYEFNLTVAEGKHSLMVHAVGVVLPGNLTIFMVDSNSTVLFTVDLTAPPTSAAATASPAATLATVSPTPSDAPSPTPTDATVTPITPEFPSGFVMIYFVVMALLAGAGVIAFSRSKKRLC